MALIQGSGVFLQDLTYLEDGNSDYLTVVCGRKDIINFEKMRQLAEVIQQVQYYQQHSYPFTKVESIYGFFSNSLPCLTEQECYMRSREIEP